MVWTVLKSLHANMDSSAVRGFRVLPGYLENKDQESLVWCGLFCYGDALRSMDVIEERRPHRPGGGTEMSGLLPSARDCVYGCKAKIVLGLVLGNLF